MEYLVAVAVATYEEVIVEDLRRAYPGWVCGSQRWYANFRPCYSQTISVLRLQKGWEIESEICRDHDHRGSIHRYRLVSEPGGAAPRLFLVGRLAVNPDGSCGCDCHARGAVRPNGCRFCFRAHLAGGQLR
jgi:hypothetical protein